MQDFTEAIAQLAVYEKGRAALMRDPTVVEALRKVAAGGWLEEAQRHANSALAALLASDHPSNVRADRAPLDHHEQHVMLSYSEYSSASTAGQEASVGV